MENKKQTVVEWLDKELWSLRLQLRGGEISIQDLGKQEIKILEQAKQMEKEQLHKCASFWRGKENEIEKPIFEQYYNETFKK